MKIKAILSVCLFLGFTLLYAQENKAIKLSLLSPTCKGACNGKIKVELGAGTIVPLTVTLSDGRSTRTFNNVIHSFVVQDLCDAIWFVSATPEKIENCKSVSAEIVVPNVEFKIRTIAVNNPTTGGQSDGSIRVKGYAQSDEGVVFENYTYTYQWSNGSSNSQIQNIEAGTYNLTMTNVETGCQTIGAFSLVDCNGADASFDIQIQGGIASIDQRTDIPMSVNLRPSSAAAWAPLPPGYVVEWKYADQIRNTPNITIPQYLAPVEVTVKVTDGCGRSKEIKRKAIICQGAAAAAKDYFLSHLVLPCVGHSDGAATLEFSTTGEGEFSKLELFDGVTTELIFDQTSRIGVESVGGIYRVELPSLSGGKTYLVSGTMGENCPVSFSFELEEKEPEKICAGYDKKKNLCLYNEECNGEQVGPDQNFSAPAFTVVNQSSVRGWGEGKTFPRCNKDLFCLCAGKPEKVEDGEEAWRTSQVGKYLATLAEYSRQTGVDWVSTSPASGKSACAHVRYCTLDPSVIYGTFNYDEKEKPNSRKDLGNGCTEVTCKAFLGLIKSKFTICGVTLPPPPLPPVKLEGNRKCEYREVNLLQMLVWHQKGELKRLFPGPERHLKYEGSNLENFLKKYTDLNDKKLRCATITFCKNDLNGYLSSTVGKNNCNQVISIPLKQTVASCEIASLNLGDGQWFGDDRNQAYREDLFRNSGLVEKAVFYCNNTSQFARVDYVNPPSFLLSDELPVALSPETEPTGTYVESNLIEQEVDEKLQVIIQDSFQQEQLLNFGSLSFQNRRIPKAIIKTDSSHLFGDYVYGEQVFSKNRAHRLVHQFANWDNETSFFMEEVQAAKKFGFEYTDTLIQYQGQLVSDDFVLPRLCTPQDTGFVITGLLKGSLHLDSFLLAQTAQLSAFYLKVSRQGQPMAFQLIEKLDTLQGVQFSENQEGKILVASGYTQGNLIINGQSQSLHHPQGFFISQMSEERTRLLQDIGCTTPVQLKGIAYSSDTSQIGLLVNGVDDIQISGSSLSVSTGTQLKVLSLSAQGVLKWSKEIPTATLDLSKLAFSNGKRKGLFLGLTFRDSLKVDTHRLKSKGQEDIALLKYDSTGVIVQLDTFGTVDGETVSQMMLSENVLFFGGELKGTTKTRSIGVMDYINASAFDGRVYISAVVDTIGANLPFPDTNVIAETLQIPAQNEHKVVKKLQRSVAMFAFPNPVQDELTLQFQAQDSEIWKLQLVDNLGSVVKQISQQVNPGFNSTKLSTASLAPGMYFLQCVAPDGYIMQTTKVVKTR